MMNGWSWTFRRIVASSFSATEKHCDSTPGTVHTTTQRHSKHTTRCATVGTPCTSAPLIFYTQGAPVMNSPRIPAPKRRPEHDTDSSHIRELLAFCVTSCTSIVCAENIGTSDMSCNLLSAQKTSTRLTSPSVHLLSV